jgi:hypothetical protein
MNSRFEQFDYSELLALQRVFHEAKFARFSEDDEIFQSPIVASLFGELVKCLSTKSALRFGAQERIAWENWLLISEQRDEWKAMLSRVKAHSRWRNYSTEQKREYIALLASPLDFSDEDRALFMQQCDALHR